MIHDGDISLVLIKAIESVGDEQNIKLPPLLVRPVVEAEIEGPPAMLAGIGTRTSATLRTALFMIGLRAMKSVLRSGLGGVGGHPELGGPKIFPGRNAVH